MTSQVDSKYSLRPGLAELLWDSIPVSGEGILRAALVVVFIGFASLDSGSLFRWLAEWSPSLSQGLGVIGRRV